MQILRTPDDRFAELPDFPYLPRYVQVDDGDGTAFSDGDPITGGGDRIFQKLVPGARGMAHTTLPGGGHFLQEDVGPELARVVMDLIDSTSR